MARGYIEQTGQRSFRERFVRGLLARMLPHPGWFRLAIKAAPMGRPWLNTLHRFGMKELAAMIELVPGVLPPSARFEGAGTAVTDEERRARVILQTGCVQQVLRPSINDATIRLLARHGVDVVVAPGAGCCGALPYHLGKEPAAVTYAKRNVDSWSKEMARAPVDAIIVNASGCGTTVKDYGHLLKRDPHYAPRAERLSDLAMDISEFLAQYELGPPKRYSSLRIAYQPACSLQHGQGILEEPKSQLFKAGYSVVDIAEAHICCGSAGTYNILQPEMAGTLRDRKVENIKAVRPDLVATGNIGCITQLESKLDVPIVHTVELLDWAYGGPIPRGLEHLAGFVSDVPEPRYRAGDYIDA